MNSDHARRSRSGRPKQPLVNSSPFSFIASWLAMLMVVPASIMVGPVREARADGANGSCELVCTRIDPPDCTTNPDSGITICTDLTCQEDPNDPDCFLLGATNYCFCNDGTASLIQGDATPAACDTSATCLDHCGPFDPNHPENLCSSGTIQLGGCGSLQFFNGGNVCSADVRAFDPETGARLVDQTVLAGPQLQVLETQAIDEVLHNHGLADSERTNVTTWARALVRAQLFSHFVQIINTPASNDSPQPTPSGSPQPSPSPSPQPRTADEQVLYDWLTNLVWQKRIDAARESWQQFLGWRNSVDFATCAWHSPNETGIVEPQGSGTVTQPGCSPGVDGVPGTDAAPNAGASADLALGCVDGETCFNFHDFQHPKDGGDTTAYYDNGTLTRCAGGVTSGDIFGLASHPTIEEFLAYGKGLARRRLTLDPGFASVVGNTSKAVFLPVALGTAGLAAGITGAAIYSQGGWEAFAKLVFPYALRTTQVVTAATETAAETAGTSLKVAGASFRLLSAIGAASVVFEVVFNILTAIEAIVEIVELNNIPVVLKSLVRASAGTTESSIHIQPLGTGDTVTTGKPDLTKLIQTADGKEEIFYAFLEAVGPEADLSHATAPQPDSTLFWSVRDASTNQSVPLTSPNQLPFTSWDGDAPWTMQSAGLNNGWFVVQTVVPDDPAELAAVSSAVATAQTQGKNVCTVLRNQRIDPATAALFIGDGRALDLGIDYKGCDGKERIAYRVAGNEFVSVPDGTSADDTDLTQTTRSKELEYKDLGGNCRIAKINQAPTASITMVSGTLKEGSAVSFSGTGNDPDGDTVTLAWDFGDGSATVPGTSVQHTFSDNGTYTVKLTPTDAPGAKGAAKTQMVTIANALPVIGTITGPTARVSQNTTVQLSASFTDAGTADTHTATWDWGDGSSVTTGTVQEANGSGTVTGSHAYTKGGSFTVTLTVTDKDTGAAEKTFPVGVNARLSGLDPAQVWIGMQNSDNAGMRLDAQAEVLLNGTVVGSGQLLDFKGGSSSFANAVLQRIPLTLSSTPELTPNTTLAVRLGVRAACPLGGSHSGKVRYWYNGQPVDTGKTADAGSRVTLTLDTDKSSYFLRSGTPLMLSSAAGTAKQSIDVAVDSKVTCPNRPFTPVGMWSLVIP